MRLSSVGHTSPSELVLDQLTALVEGGHWKVGALLPAERKLAARLGVSRVVVREAAKKLEQRGLVSIRQGIGVEVVNDPSLPLLDIIIRLLPRNTERLHQCAQARLLIEPEIAALAAARMTPAAARRLGEIHAGLRPDLKIAEAIEKDIEFHNAIAERAGNRVLALMLQSVGSLGRLSREVTMRRYGIKRAHDSHARILAALSAGHPADARKAMRLHLETAIGDLSKI